MRTTRVASLVLMILVNTSWKDSAHLSAQQPAFQLLYQVEDTAISSFALDKLRQLYTLSPTNEVIKYDATGQEQFRYNNNLLGAIGEFDVLNPMSLLCYYPDYLKVVVLDRTLSEVARVDLTQWGYWNVPALGLASDNRYWIYDGVNMQLKKIDGQGQEVLSSPSLIQLTGQPFMPVKLVERGQQVFLTDPGRGLLVFDVFGQLVKRIPLKDITSFQVLGPQIIFRQGEEWMAYHLETFGQQVLPLPPASEVRAVSWQQGAVGVLTATGLEVYEFVHP